MKATLRYFSEMSEREVSEARRATAKAEFINLCHDDCSRVFYQHASTVRGTFPTVLPMRSYNHYYAPGAWETPQPTISWNPEHSSLSFCRLVPSGPESFLVTSAEFYIQFISMPDADAFRRWEGVILDDFFRARKALHDLLGASWTDTSKTSTQYGWDELTLEYTTTEPIVFEYPCAPVFDYDAGQHLSAQQLRVYTSLRLYIPRDVTPQSCRVSRESTTETVERLVLHCS